MSHDQNKFSFELNESLYFEKGQEVAEMMQISLDPEIAIQPFHDYVSIRGVIELQGEYQKVTVNEGDEIDAFDDYHSQRYVEDVKDTIEGGATFSHRFPVEISVPSYRVEDFNQITVNIESFDYEIPQQNQLKLKSTIDIHGISTEAADSRITETPAEDAEQETTEPIEGKDVLEESRAEEALATEVEQEVTPPIAEDKETEDPRIEETLATEVVQEQAVPDAEEKEIEESRDLDIKAEVELTEDDVVPEIQREEEAFQFDIKPEQKEELPTAEVETETDEEIAPAGTPVLATESDKDDKPDEEEKNRWKHKKSQSLAEFFKNTPSSESNSMGINQNEEKWMDPSSSHFEFEESSGIYESVESSSEALADVRYLADMFRDDHDEQFAKMRLCIVQNKDTVESIAERYQIPTLQLLKQNQLDGDDLSEGQLLYIPIK